MIKNSYKNFFFILVLINAPLLFTEQVDFLCTNGVNCGALPLALPSDVDHPHSGPHDDEEAEPLAWSYPRDEEVEEKPQKRKASKKGKQS